MCHTVCGRLECCAHAFAPALGAPAGSRQPRCVPTTPPARSCLALLLLADAAAMLTTMTAAKRALSCSCGCLGSCRSASVWRNGARNRLPPWVRTPHPPFTSDNTPATRDVLIAYACSSSSTAAQLLVDLSAVAPCVRTAAVSPQHAPTLTSAACCCFCQGEGSPAAVWVSQPAAQHIKQVWGCY